jgi:serine/threonine-protein kinase
MLSTGEIIDGKYRIVRMIGEGGMGAVYEGENTRIHRRVAIKVLHSGVAEQSEAVARFEREAQAAGRIGSEHIVEVLDLGTLPNGERYMVMEFLDGESLGQRIKTRGMLSPGELCPIAHQLMEGLAAAHSAGIIHRDLKPDNVFLLKSRGGRTDFVKLVDFGISKFNQLSGDSGFSMTRTGAVMGTPYYMAPEQAKGARDLDHRVDIYACGVILYEALTGQVPFNADTFNELLFKIVLEEPRPLHEFLPNLDPGFASIVNKAMLRDPGQRFQTAQEFRDALGQWAQGHAPEIGVAAAGNPGNFRNTGPNVGRAPTLGTGTPGTWSQTGAYGEAAPAIPKSNAGLFAALAVGAVVLLGGGAFAAMKFMGDAESAQAEKAKAEEEAKKAAAQAERLDAERQAAEKQKAEAERAQAEAEKARSEALAEAEKAKAAAAASASVALAARAPAAPRAAARPAAPKKTEPAKTPAPATATTGRKIRTSL